MKRPLALIALVLFPALSDARLVLHWTFQHLYDESDLVIIGTPLETVATEERSTKVGYLRLPAVGIETSVLVGLVLKGKIEGEKITLHHYKPHADEEIDRSMLYYPFLAFPLKAKEPYIMFLKRQAEGKYSPTSGQTDSCFSVIMLSSGSIPQMKPRKPARDREGAAPKALDSRDPERP